VPNIAGSRDYLLGLESNVYPSLITEKCTLLRRSEYGPQLVFQVIPPPSTDASTAYLYVKSYRTFSVNTQNDKINLSRGGGWYPENATSQTAALEAIEKAVPFRGTVSRWNELHAAASTPEVMNRLIGRTWHAYADPGNGLPSTDTSFWVTGEFDFAKGTVTHYLIRFPANSTTTIPVKVGNSLQLRSFRLEFSSNIEGLSMQSFNFVFR
jgi:hypothetical protein